MFLEYRKGYEALFRQNKNVGDINP
jgi:hypothetical protein